VPGGEEDAQDRGPPPVQKPPALRDGDPGTARDLPRVRLRKKGQRGEEERQGGARRSAPLAAVPRPGGGARERDEEEDEVLRPDEARQPRGEAEGAPADQAAALPDPEPEEQEEADGEEGEGVRHRRVEEQVRRQERGEPDGQNGQERGEGGEEAGADREEEQRPQKAVDVRAEGDGKGVRVRVAVGLDPRHGRLQPPRGNVSEGEERRPEEGGADGGVVPRVAGGGFQDLDRLAAPGVVEAALELVRGVEVAVEPGGAEPRVEARAVAVDDGVAVDHPRGPAGGDEAGGADVEGGEHRREDGGQRQRGPAVGHRTPPLRPHPPTPRRNAAHSSGAAVLMNIPVPISKPAACVTRGITLAYQWRNGASRHSRGEERMT